MGTRGNSVSTRDDDFALQNRRTKNSVFCDKRSLSSKNKHNTRRIQKKINEQLINKARMEKNKNIDFFGKDNNVELSSTESKSGFCGFCDHDCFNKYYESQCDCKCSECKHDCFYQGESCDCYCPGCFYEDDSCPHFRSEEIYGGPISKCLDCKECFWSG
jgi:hypothetical protein